MLFPVVLRARITVLAALAALGFSCRSGPPPAIDPALAASVPAGATILAGVNLERVRASPLRHQIPPAVQAYLESLGDARTVLVASDGANYLVLAPGKAAMGSPDWVRAGRHGGTNALLAHAESLAATAEIWITVAGTANLPLTGNGENFTRLLHATDYTTVTVKLTDSVAVEIVGVCRGPELAQHLEETVRAMISLGAAGARRQAAVSGLLHRIRVGREDKVVRVSLVAQADELGAILGVF